MTENERRVVTLLANRGPLTKRHIAQLGDMGWATASKMVTRLEAQGIVVAAGTSPNHTAGKNAYVYTVSRERPLAVGIDIEYGTTRIVLTNLFDDVLALAARSTPALKNSAEVAEYLAGLTRSFVREHLSSQEDLYGIGIGLPKWLVVTERNIFSAVEEQLIEELEWPVEVDNNIRAYATYKQRSTRTSGSFVLLTIRTGIGAGILVNGSIYRGEHNLAGEISHLTVEPDGALCRCGKRGCLETVVNQSLMYTRYVELAYGEGRAIPTGGDEHTLVEGLSELFNNAASGDPQALAVVKESALHIAKGVAALLLVLNINTVYVAGHFGERGDLLATAIETELPRWVAPDISYSLSYEPLDDSAFVLGAAHLILERFCDYSVTAVAES